MDLQFYFCMIFEEVIYKEDIGKLIIKLNEFKSNECKISDLNKKYVKYNNKYLNLKKSIMIQQSK